MTVSKNNETNHHCLHTHRILSWHCRETHLYHRGLWEMNATCWWQRVINTLFACTACVSMLLPSHTKCSVDAFMLCKLILARHSEKKTAHTPYMPLHITDLHACVCLFRWTAFSKVRVCCPVSVFVSAWEGGGGAGDIMKMDDAVTVGWCLSQCKHFLLLYYHYHGWCYCYNSHFRKRLSCWDRKAETAKWKTETLVFGRWIWVV